MLLMQLNSKIHKTKNSHIILGNDEEKLYFSNEIRIFIRLN